jgi:hypothetical protein
MGNAFASVNAALELLTNKIKISSICDIEHFLTDVQMNLKKQLKEFRK